MVLAEKGQPMQELSEPMWLNYVANPNPGTRRGHKPTIFRLRLVYLSLRHVLLFVPVFDTKTKPRKEELGHVSDIPLSRIAPAQFDRASWATLIEMLTLAGANS